MHEVLKDSLRDLTTLVMILRHSICMYFLQKTKKTVGATGDAWSSDEEDRIEPLPDIRTQACLRTEGPVKQTNKHVI